MSIPLIFNFSPKLWQSAVQIMLKKYPTFPQGDKLRSIQLLNSEYNVTLKFKLIHQTIHRKNNSKALGN